MSIERGTLYVVATPIGNRADLGERARSVLAAATTVLAEDTRRTRPLLREMGIGTPVSALHDHNERGRVEALLAQLRNGDTLALVSDAGTPLISDPGFLLVRAAREAGLPVRPVPGPCAAIAALSVAGLPADRFAFEGFLPSKPVARRKVLESLRHDTRTLVFYEAVHRIRETLDDMAELLGAHRRASLARELTKLHETVKDGRLGELATWAKDDPDVVRGEIVLVVEGGEEKSASAIDARSLVTELARELPAGKAASIAAKLTGESRKQLYQWLIDQGE